MVSMASVPALDRCRFVHLVVLLAVIGGTLAAAGPVSAVPASADIGSDSRQSLLESSDDVGSPGLESGGMRIDAAENMSDGNRTENASTGGTTENVSDNDQTENTSTRPDAAIDAPTRVDIGTPVTFDASSSNPGSDEEIDKYVGSINVTNYSTTTTEPTFEHTFSERGIETVALEIVTSEKRRAKAGRTFIVEPPDPTVEGQVVHPDGTAADGSVRLVDGDKRIATNVTDDDGSFTLSGDRYRPYDLVYVDEGVNSGKALPRPDGRIDLYAIDSVTPREENAVVDVGTVVLPEPHEAEATVRTHSRTDVSGAPVTVTHKNGGPTGSIRLATGDDGQIPSSDDRTLELDGSVDFEIKPLSDRFANEPHVESMYVNDDVKRIVTLPEAIRLSLEGASNPVVSGDTVTLAVESTDNKDVEIVTWDVDGRSLNASTDRAIQFQVTDSGEFVATAEVTTTSGERVTLEKRVTVRRPGFDLAIAPPDRTATHVPFTVTATHGLTDQNHSIETYEWTLRDEDGTPVDTATTNSSTADFEVTEVGSYTLELAVTDEFGVTAATSSTIGIETVPSWADAGSSTVEIDGVERPDAVEPAETVPLTVTASNTGTVSDVVDVVLEDGGTVVTREEVAFRAGKTKSISLTHTAPERTGDHAFTVTTEHDRTEVSYTVTEEPDLEPVPSRDTENESDAAGSGDDGPQELDLLPTLTVGTDIAPESLPRDRLRTLFLGVVAITILSGLALVGYAIAVGPSREGLEPASVPRESDGQ
jgi:hypothetical protein